jgi:poly(glycerol-phosphate) alpha-glucosyltransferase
MSSRVLNVTFYSVVPAPYQRDLFFALSQLPYIKLQVHYLEASCADSPWPAKALQPYENVLSGGFLGWGNSRFHINTHWPNLSYTDVVVLNGYQSLTAQLILQIQAQKTPCIFWGEKMVGTSSGVKSVLQKTLALGLHNCKAIAAIGAKAQRDYQERFPGKPVFNIPYYCDLSQFARDNSPQQPESPITILFCGQMIERKGVDVLLKSFVKVLDSGLKARLLLVGREAELRQMLQTVPPDVRDSIDYAGFQAPDALHKFFCTADLFVLPSRYDGWGVVVNQALGASLPIICSDMVGAAEDLISQGDNGIVFPVGDVEALSSALKYYLETPNALQRASQASAEKAQEWSPQVGAKRWLEVFQEVAA